jgi:hypothetical protein
MMRCCGSGTGQTGCTSVSEYLRLGRRLLARGDLAPNASTYAHTPGPKDLTQLGLSGPMVSHVCTLLCCKHAVNMPPLTLLWPWHSSNVLSQSMLGLLFVHGSDAMPHLEAIHGSPRNQQLLHNLLVSQASCPVQGAEAILQQPGCCP